MTTSISTTEVWIEAPPTNDTPKETRNNSNNNDQSSLTSADHQILPPAASFLDDNQDSAYQQQQVKDAPPSSSLLAAAQNPLRTTNIKKGKRRSPSKKTPVFRKGSKRSNSSSLSANHMDDAMVQQQQQQQQQQKRPRNKRKRRGDDTTTMNSSSSVLEGLPQPPPFLRDRRTIFPPKPMYGDYESDFEEEDERDQTAVVAVSIAAPPTTTIAAAAAKPPPKQQADNNNYSPKDDTPFEIDMEGFQRAMKQATIPICRFGLSFSTSLEYRISKAWCSRRTQMEPVAYDDNNNDNAATATTLLPTLFSSDETESNLQVLFHLIRANLASSSSSGSRGGIKKAMDICHNMLKSSYEQAETMLGKKGLLAATVSDECMILREKIAGIWCLYAHVFCQILQTDSFLGRTTTRNKLSSMENKLWDHAIAILTLASTCRFVGNHAAVTLALSRLRFRQRQSDQLRPYPKQAGSTGTLVLPAIGTAGRWLRSAQVSLQICREGLQRSSSTTSMEDLSPPTSKFVTYLEPYGLESEVGIHTTVKQVQPVLAELLTRQSAERMNVSEGEAPTLISQSYLSEISNLPKRLKNSLQKMSTNANNPTDIPYLFQDQTSAKLICMEMNRLSRLEQSVKKYDIATVLHLVWTPKTFPNQQSSHIPNDPGIMWQDFLLFQTMDMVLLEEHEISKCGYVLNQPSTTPLFFNSEVSNSIWQDIDDVQSEVALPNSPVYTNVSFPCNFCMSAFFPTQEERNLHITEACKGRTGGSGDLILREPWEVTTMRAISTSGKSRRSNAGTEKRKCPGGECISVDYACQKCCSFGFATEEERDVHQAECSGERQGNSDNINDGIEDALTAFVLDEEYIVVSQDEEHLDSSNDAAGSVNEQPTDEASAFSVRITRGRRTRNGQKTDTMPRKTKRKTTSRVNLKNVFAVEVDAEDAETGRNNDKKPAAAAAQAPPRKCGASCTATEYACRKCFVAGFSVQSERDAHESDCKGHSKNSKVELWSEWPDLSLSKPKLTGKNAIPAGTRNSCFGEDGRPKTDSPSPHVLQVLNSQRTRMEGIEEVDAAIDLGAQKVASEQPCQSGGEGEDGAKKRTKRPSKDAASNNILARGRARLRKATSAKSKGASRDEDSNNDEGSDQEEKKIESINDNTTSSGTKFIPIMTGGR